MNQPLVSIVIPSYKSMHFEQCLRSALGQSYLNVEIIVSDNCPTEEIHDICKKFPGVIYRRSSVFREKNVASAIFSGGGDFIKPLFDDDILHPFCVEKMVRAFAGNDDVKMVFSASQVIDFDNVRLSSRRPFCFSGVTSGVDLFRILSIGGINVVGEFSSIMFKKTKIWEIGFDNLFKLSGHDFSRGLADAAFYCNLTKFGSSYYLDEELSYFRKDDRLFSNSNPVANPDFGFCFSDGIELINSAYLDNVITHEELCAASCKIEELLNSHGELYSSIKYSYDRYLSLCENEILQ